jgi:hypothetical protein
MTNESNVEKLDFSWATKRWEDPVRGAEVVRLSPESSLHFRNNYFHFNMFTSDGRYAVMVSQKEPEKAPGTLWRVDLHSGQTTDLGTYNHDSIGWWAVSPQSHMLNAMEIVDGVVEIVQIDLDTTERRRIRPSVPLFRMLGVSFSADDRHVYTPFATEEKSAIENMGKMEYIAKMGAEPGHNIMYRIDLQTGQTESVFECADWWMGHPNPNPANPDLFMCCQEGFLWSEKYPKPSNYQRVRVYNLRDRRWLDLSRGHILNGHEIWSDNGKRTYGHGHYHGHHQISIFDVDKGCWRICVMQQGMGESAHVHPAPNEKFVVGDGYNFGKNNQHEAKNLGQKGDGDNPWCYDGVGQDSPGETIWKFELPAESIVTEPSAFGGEIDEIRLGTTDSVEAVAAAVQAHPERAIKVTPACKFRSRMKMVDYPIRLETNATVTPDSRWVVFQSCNEDAIHEVWAARVED